jgi:Flp pilus assembly protein TadG
MHQSQARFKEQRGTVLALVTAGIVAIAGAAALSVDVGFFFVVRNQLQNVVDAATLAGAQGLIADPGNFATNGQAKQLAMQIAAQNKVGGQPVNLSPSEITFPTGNTVRIQMTRPARTFFGVVLGMLSVNVQVAAQAVVAPVSNVGGPTGGMRPWAVLDQFGHGGLCVPPNDADINSPPHGAFQTVAHTWMGVKVNSDTYISPYDPSFDGWDLSREGDCSNVTGFVAPRDVNGTRIWLKQFKSGKNPWITPGNFSPIALGNSGGSTYQDNIIYGYNGVIRVNDIIPTETGVINGPTGTGVAALIAKDPSAHMEKNGVGRWVVVSSSYPLNESPRIVPIPMYGVYYTPDNGHSDFKVTSIASFFIEGTDGKDVWGRFIQSRAKNAQPGTPAKNGGTQTVGGGGRLVATVRLVDVTN